ncbi:MAG TPA: alpha/beta fold hydrolase [Thermoanaerobaculia bacterium]|nr:alpha/beta fold hydrolase [Thermoanaerobaculia bacterium]
MSRSASLLIAGTAVLLLSAGPTGLRTDASRKSPELLTPCEVPGVAGKGRCGTYEVYEDRAARKGRKISLKIVVLPATGAPIAPDPFVFLSGGPGEAATESAPGLAGDLRAIREHRDLLFVDQRGTGGSHPLNCEMYVPRENLQSYLGEFFPVESVRRCRRELEKNSDLTRYTTPDAMDDLDDVRAALGYERLNVLGGSYGTRAAQVYLKRHPRHVRTVVLHGVVPTDDHMPLHFPHNAQRALSGVLEECAAEPACRAAFPDLAREARDLFSGLARSPVQTAALNPRTGDPTEVSLSRDLAAEAVRYMLYSPAAAGEIPAVIHQAAQGDFAPLAERALYGRVEIVGGGSAGLYLSVTCSEDVPWIRPGEGERQAEGTFLGDYRLRQQRAACALWPRAPIPEDYFGRVTGGAPVLLLSGQWDPATPPSNSDTVAKSLPRSLHLVVPHGGHAFEGLLGVDCVLDLIAAFVERGTTDGLETSCVSKIRRPPFRVESFPTKVMALEDKDLSRLEGRYVEEGGTLEAVYEVRGGKIVASVGGEQFLLVPVSPTRFRIPGDPMADVTFEVEEGRVQRIVVTEGGTPVRKFVPRKG